MATSVVAPSFDLKQPGRRLHTWKQPIAASICIRTVRATAAGPFHRLSSTRCGLPIHRIRGRKAVVKSLAAATHRVAPLMLPGIDRDGRGQPGGPDAPCPSARYAALLLDLRIRPVPLPADATLGSYIEDNTRRYCSGIRGGAIAKVKEEDRAAGRGTRSNCVTAHPTTIPIYAKTDLCSRPLGRWVFPRGPISMS